MIARNKEKLKILVYSIILVVYILGFVLLFNYKTILGIGYYHNEKNFTTTYSGGSGGLNVKIFARHIQYNDHEYGIEITPFSTPDSHLMGITYLDYRLAAGTVDKRILATNYSIPVPTYSLGYGAPIRTKLFQNNNLTCKGFADVVFKVDNIDETYRISFEIGVIIKLDGDAINYNEIALIWVNVIYLTCTLIPLGLLFKSIKKFKFLKWYSDDIRDRDELFHEKLMNTEESLSNKNS